MLYSSSSVPETLRISDLSCAGGLPSPLPVLEDSLVLLGCLACRNHGPPQVERLGLVRIAVLTLSVAAGPGALAMVG